MRQFSYYNVVILLLFFTCHLINAKSKTKTDDKIKFNDTDSPSKISLNVSFQEVISTESVGKSNPTSPTKTTTRSTKKVSKKSSFSTSVGLSEETTRTTTTKSAPKIADSKNVTKEDGTKQLFECPKDNEAPFQLFYTSCNSNKECKSLGPNNLCCKLFGSKRCIEGKVIQPKEPKHEPILFVIPRKCPKPGQILAETWWNIQTCESDSDCWPRICCPDGRLKYCRTSQPEFESSSIPVARQLASPLESVSQYLQCTLPPPPVFDPHPKPCNNTLDCFPNLCCAEAGKKHCRPPKRSILSLLTGFAQGFSNVSFIRDWTENLVIK